MYSAYITEIGEIHKHSNADRLQCCTIFGQNVIVDMNYHLGQKVIFFPVEGQLSEQFANDNNLVRKKDENGNNIGGYLDPDKRNITAVRLRGEKSEGLILPIECLAKYGDISKLKAGDKIETFNGVEICKKYIPKTKHQSNNHNQNGNKTRNKSWKPEYPLFMEHADTEQLAYHMNDFKPGDLCYITLKMDGTSGRTSNTIEIAHHKRNWFERVVLRKPTETKEYKIVSGTRRTILANYDGGYYGNNEFRKKYNDILAERLPKGMTAYYEIVGYVNESTTIMPSASCKKANDKELVKQYGETMDFTYGLNPGENEMYIYRMTMTNEDGFVVELPWETVKLEAEKMGLKTVPEFDKFIFTTQEDLMARVEKYYDGADPIGKNHIREGVVIRIERPNFTAFKHKNFTYKVLRGIAMAQLTDEQLEGIDADILSEM